MFYYTTSCFLKAKSRISGFFINFNFKTLIKYQILCFSFFLTMIQIFDKKQLLKLMNAYKSVCNFRFKHIVCGKLTDADSMFYIVQFHEKKQHNTERVKLIIIKVAF